MTDPSRLARAMAGLGPALMGRIALAAACGAISVVFFRIYFVRHVKLRDCFNDLGRCFDGDTGVVYLEQSGPIWLTLALVSGALALWIARPRGR